MLIPVCPWIHPLTRDVALVSHPPPPSSHIIYIPSLTTTVRRKRRRRQGGVMSWVHDHRIKQVALSQELSPISIPEHKLPPFSLRHPPKLNNIFIPFRRLSAPPGCSTTHNLNSKIYNISSRKFKSVLRPNNKQQSVSLFSPTQNPGGVERLSSTTPSLSGSRIRSYISPQEEPPSLVSGGGAPFCCTPLPQPPLPTLNYNWSPLTHHQ